MLLDARNTEGNAPTFLGLPFKCGKIINKRTCIKYLQIVSDVYYADTIRVMKSINLVYQHVFFPD